MKQETKITIGVAYNTKTLQAHTYSLKYGIENTIKDGNFAVKYLQVPSRILINNTYADVLKYCTKLLKSDTSKQSDFLTVGKLKELLSKATDDNAVVRILITDKEDSYYSVLSNQIAYDDDNEFTIETYNDLDVIIDSNYEEM